MLRWLFRILAVLVVLALAGGGFLYWKLRPRVEKIPAELAQVDRSIVDTLRLPGVKGQPPLVLAEQRGHTVFLLVEGKESMEAREGRELVRALNTWDFPADVRGFLVGEAEGLGFLSWKIDEYVTALQRESRFPLYMDYEGQVRRGFQLPKGHTGLVVLGKDGRVVYRHSGRMDEAELQKLSNALGLQPPPPPPPGPPVRAFQVADLDEKVCGVYHNTCAFFFLSRPIAAADLPGKDNQEAWRDPDARLVAAFAGRALPDHKRGLFIGSLAGIDHADGWRVAQDAPGLREVLDVPAGTTAVVVVHDEVVFEARGFIPAWKYSHIEELLELPPGE